MVTEFWGRRKLSVNIFGILIFLLSFLIISKILCLLFPNIEQKMIDLIAIIFTSICIVIFFDKKPLEWIGLGIHKLLIREILIGIILSVVLVIIISIPSLLLSSRAPFINPTFFSSPNLLVQTIIMRLSYSLLEELFYRGYLFQRIIEISGVSFAVVILSIIFASTHYFNPESTFLSVINTFFAGIFFSLLYIKTGSLWAPIAAHVTWNIVLGDFLGLPVSGLNSYFGNNLLVTNLTNKYLLLTGGYYGPEASLVCTIGILIGIYFIVKSNSIFVSPYVYAKIFKNGIN